MKSRWLALTAAFALVLSGCQVAHRFANKPWGKGTFIPAAVCAVVGAGAGVGIQEMRVGETCASVNGDLRCVDDDADHAVGAIVGAVIGAAVCGVLGHYFLEPDPAEAAPAPLPEPSSRRIVLRGLSFFDFDRAEIGPDSGPVLDTAADVLLANPDVRVAIEGHTDSSGTEEYNEQLSLQRAEAVYRYLVNRGVDPERLQAVGYGESRPVAENDTEVGRAQNRRTELRIIEE